MKNSSISDKVFEVNLNYVKLQNQTKELFFKCLNEERELEYFEAELKKIWGNVDYEYLNEQIEEYQAEIHERNTNEEKETKIEEYQAEIHERNTNEEKETKGITKGIFALVPILVIMDTDKKFQEAKKREYNTSVNSYAYKSDKEEYLKLKVKRYNNQIVPYYNKNNQIIRYVQPSTYDSMIQNTNLTRSGWNQTLSDGDEVGQGYYYIPNHSFSCPDCIEHQEKPMTKYEVERLVGEAEETEGELLHPNCKCELTFFTERTKLKRINNLGELEEQYHIRQKVNTLTLRKEEVLTDMRIQKSLGNQDIVDELNNMRNKLNKEIRNLQSKLPTEELRKQVIAINRTKSQSSGKYVEQAKRSISIKKQKQIRQKTLKEIESKKDILKQNRKTSSQTHKEMQKLFKIKENRPKYMEQLEKKQQALKETKKIINKKNKDMKYWEAKQQELSLKVDIKNLKELINK